MSSIISQFGEAGPAPVDNSETSNASNEDSETKVPDYKELKKKLQAVKMEEAEDNDNNDLDTAYDKYLDAAWDGADMTKEEFESYHKSGADNGVDMNTSYSTIKDIKDKEKQSSTPGNSDGSSDSLGGNGDAIGADNGVDMNTSYPTIKDTKGKEKQSSTPGDSDGSSDSLGGNGDAIDAAYDRYVDAAWDGADMTKEEFKAYHKSGADNGVDMNTSYPTVKDIKDKEKQSSTPGSSDGSNSSSGGNGDSIDATGGRS